MEGEIIGLGHGGTAMVHWRKRRHQPGASPSGKIVLTWPEEGLAMVRAIGMDSADVVLNIAGLAGESGPQH
jgi:hypothetical protein